MSSANSVNEKPIAAAFVGIDWADQKHDIVLCAATGNAQFEHRRIGGDPDALAEWVLEMQGRFGYQGRILICLEQSRGAYDHNLSTSESVPGRRLFVCGLLGHLFGVVTPFSGAWPFSSSVLT